MNIDRIIRLYNSLQEDSVVQNLISQANSRYILYCVNEPIENFPQYTDKLTEKCTNIAINYLTFGYEFFISGNKLEASKSLEKSATILEHINCYDSCENQYKKFYSIISSLAYYEASQYSKSFIVIQRTEVDTIMAKMIKNFLAKDFVKLSLIIDEYQFADETIFEQDSEEIIYITILSSFFSCIIQFTYSGEAELMIKAKEIITDLITLANINEEPHLWWIFRLLSLINDEYSKSSLWNVIPPIINTHNHKIINRYILANICKENMVIELFKSQLDCLKYINSDKGAVISLPTSSGKTKIAEIAIFKNLVEHPGSLCLYIAPFRSLAYEVEGSLSVVLESAGYNVSHLYGNYLYNQIDRILIDDSDVIIATPEKAKAIMRANDELLERLKLVIVDEGHLVGRQDRYITSELFLEELKYSLGLNEGKMLLLSAVLPNLSDFSYWITGENNLIGISDWRTSSQRLGALTLRNNRVDINWKGDYETFNKNFVEKKLIRPKRSTTTGKVYKAVYFPKDKKEAVATSAIKLLSLGSVLIYVGRTNMVLSQSRIVSKLIEENKISHEWTNKNDFEIFRLACEETYGVNSEIFKFAKQGIICHSGKLPPDIRLRIEKLMQNGTPKIIVATSTLAQGVNIGVSTVIIANVSLDEKTTVDIKDFWNIAGRAGRAFVDTEGKILYAINGDDDEWSKNKQINQMNKYFNQSNIEKAVSGVYLLLKEIYLQSKRVDISFNTLLELVAENQFETNHQKEIEQFMEFVHEKFDLVDDTLLALNIKYKSYDFSDASEWIDNCFRGSLAYITAMKESDFNEDKLILLLKARNSRVISMAGNHKNWTYLSNSSTSLRLSISMAEIIDDIIISVGNYIDSNFDFDELINLIESIDDILYKLPTKNISHYINEGDVKTIRRMWFGGKSINSINKISSDSMKLCNEYYGFHFSWIASAFAKKMRVLGYEYEANKMEAVALLAESGLPNVNSAKIYLSGIKSREIAVEISSLIDIEEDMSISKVKELLSDITLHNNVFETMFSETARDWLRAIYVDNNSIRILEINETIFRFDRSELQETNRVLIKKSNGMYYVCSFDYMIKCRIHPSNKTLFDKISNINGVWLERMPESNRWILKSDNPYITIK